MVVIIRNNELGIASMISVGDGCGACRHFIGEAAALEQAVPGYNILSSAYGSVRAHTGLCQLHDTFVTTVARICSDFSKREA